ncbi:MAG: stage V sporulation protein T [Lachnospiraceae bacterium]|nr:stage V sporulation protein T [Lachnospiraceae bacterium]
MDVKKQDISFVGEIAGYCRISVDEELDRDNTSIENQKKIIREFVKSRFPKCKLTIYEDRDRSGYTFEQREQYQRLRKRLMSGEISILIVKDFSRFSRRNSKGLVELEDLRDAGVRIISIGDSIDYPTYDDWTSIQFRFLINEMPVTDTSKKVRNVISRRQADGEWICTVPYGYIITNMKKQEIAIVPDEAEVIRKVFELYNDGWGYKKISNYLTEMKIPTPRMKEIERKLESGDECKLKAKPEWSIITVQGILMNDFYIGTLRQHKYTRKSIHGVDKKLDASEHFVFENHHEPIVDYKTFAYTQELLKKRTTSHYRGIKKYDNVYSGFMTCGDCGAPMFSMSRGDIAPAYICGSYHRRGLKGCSSHHVRVDFLDRLLKDYVRMVRDNSADMIKELELAIKKESVEVQESETTFALLENQLSEAKDELKAVKKRKIKEIAKADEDSIEIIEETYAEIEEELMNRIKGIQNQIELSVDKRNDIIRVNRLAKTAIDIFNDILEKDTLDKRDLELLIDRITVYEDKINIKLKPDIDNLLQVAAATTFRYEESDGEEILEAIENPEKSAVNFNVDSKVIENSLTTRVRMKAKNHPERLFTVNVISSGDPLEIFTDREGEIILKKYSPIGELSLFAKQYADAMAQATGFVVAIADRDQLIAVAGNGKKELLGVSVSKDLENLMTERENLVAGKGEKDFISISPEEDDFAWEVISPIICEGDVIGAVLILSKDTKQHFGEAELRLAQTASSFLGRQMEN